MNILDYETIFDYRGESYNNAMEKYPFARHWERQALIDMLAIVPESHILDAPAGGGYFASGLRELCGPEVNITCVEPAANFAMGIHAEFSILNCPLEEVPLPSESVDVVGSLAGLHHIEDRSRVFAEWRRLLKPGGRIAVADVEVDTGPALFLNDFVDRYTPQGHDGLFFQPDEFSQLLNQQGIKPVQELSVTVPWEFDHLQAMADFCMQLFFLQNLETELLIEALTELVGVRQLDRGRVALDWKLRYALGVLAG